MLEYEVDCRLVPIAHRYFVILRRCRLFVRQVTGDLGVFRHIVFVVHIEVLCFLAFVFRISLIRYLGCALLPLVGHRSWRYSLLPERCRMLVLGCQVIRFAAPQCLGHPRF